MSKPTKKFAKIDCNKCQGTGKIELSERLSDTLKAASALQTVTAEKVAKKLKYKGNPTAINNRLRYLMDLGFFTRNRQGKTYYYKQIKF